MLVRLCRPSAFPTPTLTLTNPFRRRLSTTPTLHLRTSELQPSHLATLKSSPTRLWSSIHSTASFGPGPRYSPHPEHTGLSRLTLTDADKAARDWFIDTTRALSCTTHVDSLGNIFAIRPGLRNDVAPVFVGSHLDSQPLGGRFDGVLGVMAGVEMLRVLEENWIETEGPVGVVNWTNEEGARWAVSMMGSGAWAGVREVKQIEGLKEVGGEGKTVGEELERIGYRGEVECSARAMPMAAHFELHIEQGPVLERQGRSVGVVKGVQAYEWFEIAFQGKAAHTGTTPLDARADPTLSAAFLIAQGQLIARKYGGLASVGIMRTEPGSANTIPERVVLTLDVRHEDDGVLEKMKKDLVAALDQQATLLRRATEGGSVPPVSYEMKSIFSSRATKFDDLAISFVEQSGQSLVGKENVRRMVSGAGHDSVNTAKVCPTAMVFVPCKNGVSHHPEEWCSQEHCAVGTDVIIQSVLRFDKHRHEAGDLSGQRDTLGTQTTTM